jgi:O-antigen/teichoic acid export membrane protein
LRGSRLAWEASWSFLLKTASTGLTFLSTVLLARLLGAEGYGIYAYAYAFVWLLALPAQAGLPNLVIRETAQGLAQARPDLVRGIWRWAERVVTGLSLVVVLGFGPALIAWRGGWQSVQGGTMAWALALVPLMALGNLRGAALRGLQHIVAGQLPEFVLRPGLFLLLVLCAALFAADALSAPTAMALHAAAALAAFLVGAWMLWRRMPPPVREARATVESKGWLVSGTLFALMAGFSMVNNQASTVLLGVFQPSDQVGVYQVAVQVANLAAFGLQAINMVVAPRFAALYARGETLRLPRLVVGSARVVLAFNVLLTGLFVLLGRLFFPLVFGAEFAASYGPLLILLVGQMVNSTTGSVGYLLNMTGHERETLRGMAVAAGLNIVLNLLLISGWGILGAASATAVSMIVWNVLLWWRVRKVLGINSLAFNIAAKKAV